MWVSGLSWLYPSKDGRRSNGPNVFDLSIADKSTDKALARVALDDKHSVGFALDGAAEVKGTGDAKSVTYAKVRKDTDVRLTSRRTGVKEELVLASPAAPDRFMFPLELKGLTASLNEVGDVIYRDAAGVERARTPHGFMIDANVDPRSQEAPMSLGVTYALIPFKGGTALEVRLDRAWLDDPARVYPVTVDPEIHAHTSGDDTYVMSGFSRDNSYDAELKVGTYDGGAHIGRSYMHFDTSALVGSTVQRAELHLAERHSWNCTYWPEHVFRVTQGWDGRTMRDFPGAAVDPGGIGGIWNAGPCGGRDAQWDVTGFARYWASVGERGGSLSLRATNESDNHRYKKYASTEAGAPPRLDVWFTNSPPAVPYNVTPANGHVFPSPYTSVSATYSDPDGTPGVMAIGVWAHGTNQLMWSTWTGTLCSGCGASYNVPALPDNWYYVMAIGHDGVQYSSAWSSPQYFFIDTLAPSASELTPANGANGASPTHVSARYTEPYGFTGYVHFWLYTTGGTKIVENWSAITNPGAVATVAIPNLAAGTYNLWAMPWDTRQTGPQIGPNTFTVGGPTTTTTAPTTTTTTAPTTTTTVPPTTTTTVPSTTTTVPPSTTTTTSTSTTSTTIATPRAPVAPRNVSASPGDREVTVSWTAPAGAELNGSTLTGFTVAVVPNCSCGSLHTDDPNATSFVVTGLTNGTEHAFQVRADSSAGPGALSDPAVRATPKSLREPLKVLTWNLHRGEETDLPESHAGPIRTSLAKVVGLQEVTREMAEGIAAALQWPAPHYEVSDANPCLGLPPIPTVGMCAAYGNAILSEYPLTILPTRNLTTASGEARLQRILLHATVTIPSGELVHVYTTHLASDSDSTEDERIGQADETRAYVQFDAAGVADFRAVLTGDFNSPPQSRAIAEITSHFTDAWMYADQGAPDLTGCFPDPPADQEPRCRIDYIFLWKEAGLIAESAVVGGSRSISDHYYVVAGVH